MTTPVAQAVEAAMRPAFEEWRKDHPETRFWNNTDAMLAAFIGGRATLARPLEVAAPVGDAATKLAELIWQVQDIFNDGPDDSDKAMATGLFLEAVTLAKKIRAASRAPVAVGVEPGLEAIGRWEQTPSGHWEQYDDQEHRISMSVSPPGGAGGSVGAQSVPLGGGEVQKCSTCGGSGWLGGPSYYNPGEGGEPCADCENPPLQPQDAKDARIEDPLYLAVADAWANYERMGGVCSFEGQPMIYASTLEEIHTASTKGTAS